VPDIEHRRGTAQANYPEAPCVCVVQVKHGPNHRKRCRAWAKEPT
jgi:hypothetical protein